jgi:hypothetical protein
MRLILLRSLIASLLLCIIIPITAHPAHSNNHQIAVIMVSGNDLEQGLQYGHQLQNTLKNTLNTIENYYITQHHLTYHALFQQANKLYLRFPADLQQRIQGEAQGANIAINDAIILNGMETLGTLLHKPSEHCAFAFLTPNLSATHQSLIGRNYDYSEPFDKIAPDLTVTVFKNNGSIPTASIALPGEMYCPNCTNAKGLFLELNNGSPSGGSKVNTSAISLLAQMETNIEQANTLKDLINKLNNLPADFSLIINAADQNQTASLEFSSTRGMKINTPPLDQSFVSTNYFLNQNWQNIPKPNNINTWEGLTRRKNLLKLISKEDLFTISGFEALMDKGIINGGAKWAPTIYQIIFDSKNQILYLKTKSMTSWQQINLKPLYNA